MEKQIRQEYLADLTEIMVRRQKETGTGRSHWIDTELWKTDPWEIQVRNSIFSEVFEVRSEKSLEWTIFV
ncbi:hypothetical protein GSS87_06175 [Corynebacterium sp. 4HC-13]|uniref:hypothetical protein n=1 Tax=Corynebacterium anserum TaxID=2684406 RepID=UPI00163A2591|nr:hypothetical protein [Corynebacterium anserum]MBC2681984.1 hypothetical protein [Corynebacterium anserum]